MRKVFGIYALLLFLAAITMFSCSNDYDDSGIKKDISDLQSRVEKLETWCTTANGQITALQGLVTALQGNDYVTGVTPVMEGTTEVGYTITFTKSKPITIMHGKDGVNGSNGSNGINGATPIIGVAKADDGLYYWTIQTGTAEATWMLDAEGNKIRTTGDNGADGTGGAAGVTPQISIAKDGDAYYWKLNGEWMMVDGQKVPATGPKGDTGATGPSGSNGAPGAAGDSFFTKVEPKDGYVEFTLAGTPATVLKLALYATTVNFDGYTPLQLTAQGETAADKVKVTLPETLKKADFAAISAEITSLGGKNTAIARTADQKPWTVSITKPVFNDDGNGIATQPVVKVTVPDDASNGASALLKVTVVDSKGVETSSTRVLFYDNRVAVTGVTLTPATLTVNVGKTSAQLKATVAPANATNQNVTWTSSDVTVATVADGVVIGEKTGTATITVNTEDGSFTATCAVTVENIALEKIELADASISIGDKKALVPTFTPADATIQTLTWTSSDTSIATINSITGEIEGKAAGEVTVTATSTEYTSIKGTCKVKVEDKSNFIEVNGLIVAVGNLVADGVNGVKIGSPNDCGLYFQCCSLVGWSGGTNGDGTGAPTDKLALEIKVKPIEYTAGDSWNKAWGGNSGTNYPEKGQGDPCKYYLKDGWRLPEQADYETLFNKQGYPQGSWTWDATSTSAIHTDSELTLPASGRRSFDNGSFDMVGIGQYWSSSGNYTPNGIAGYYLKFDNATVDWRTGTFTSFGMSVRCVKDKVSK